MRLLSLPSNRPAWIQGIRKVPLAILSEQKHPAHGRHLPALVGRNQAQSLQVSAGELADGCERLGSRSEVQGFRVEVRHRLLIEGFPTPESAEFLSHLSVGPPVGGAYPHVHTVGRTFSLEVMRAARARVDLYCQHLGAAPGQDLDFRHEPGDDQVADQVRQALLQIQRLAYAADMPAPVLNAEEQRPAGRVREGNDRLEHTLRRGQIALELQRLALGALKQLDEVHALGSVLGSLRACNASESDAKRCLGCTA